MIPSTEREFLCGMCGVTFISTAGHGRYCEKCRRIKQANKKRDKIADSTRVCPRCGKEFAVKSNGQLYCSEKCRPKYALPLEETAQPCRKNYDSFTFYLPRGSRAYISATAKRLHISTSDLLRIALTEYFKENEPETAELLLNLPD